MINSCKIKTSRVILFLLLIISLLMYLFCPKQMTVSMPLFYATFGLAVISVAVFMINKKKTSYIDFDTLFIFVLFLISFLSTFFYGKSYFRALFLGFEFNTDYINSGSLLSLIGIQSYCLGSTKVHSSRYRQDVKVKSITHKVIGTNGLFFCVLIGMFLFFLTGGWAYYQMIYKNGAGGDSLCVYILLITIVFAIVLVATEFYNSEIDHRYHISKYSVAVVCLFCFVLLYLGNRTAASNILLPAIGLYALFKKRVSIKIFIVFMLIAIFSMWIFQNVRSNVEVESEKLNPIMIFTDLTIPSRTIYEAMDYVDDYGFTYGKTMVTGMVAVVPKLASFLNMSESGSAEVLTNETYDKLHYRGSRTGLGTTVISDIYLSFGLVGVVILMYFLGLFVSVSQKKALQLNYYGIIIYSALLSNSVFLARSSFTYPVRNIVWGLVVAMLVVTLSNYNAKSRRKS